MTISNHAAAAKMIRTELKKHGIKGRVRARSYSGGSSVDVYLTDELPATVKAVEAYAGQFQYGRFDGMTDSYEYSNKRSDLPQVSFVFVRCDYSDEVWQAAWSWARGYYGAFDGAPESYAEASRLWLDGENVAQRMHRVMNGSEGRFWASRKPCCRIMAAAS